MSSYSDRLGQLRQQDRAPLAAMAQTALAMVRTMMRTRQTRRMLQDMDDRMLADIGIGRGDAWAESRRAMWDIAPGR